MDIAGWLKNKEKSLLISKYHWLIKWQLMNRRKYKERIVERRDTVRACFGLEAVNNTKYKSVRSVREALELLDGGGNLINKKSVYYIKAVGNRRCVYLLAAVRDELYKIKPELFYSVEEEK